MRYIGIAFCKAAENGNSYGNFNLGALYEYGIGVAKNPRRAYDYYKKALLQGNPEAKKKFRN